MKYYSLQIVFAVVFLMSIIMGGELPLLVITGGSFIFISILSYNIENKNKINMEVK